MHISERIVKSRMKHEAIAAFAAAIEDLYSQSKCTLHSDHQLFSLLSDTKDVASEWSKGNFAETDMDKFFSTLHIERIFSATRFLSAESNREKFLRDLLDGSLNFLDRKISHAKSILWELEVFTKIKKVIPNTVLDEPDVVVNINQFSIALPCKKIFSEKGVPKVLSNAVAQIERRHEFGVVAMNIDDMIPEGVVLQKKSFKEAGDTVYALNLGFLSRHERHFKKYLDPSRIVAVLVSTSLVADILDETPKFNNLSQWAIWTIPNLKPEHAKAIDELRSKVIG